MKSLFKFKKCVVGAAASVACLGFFAGAVNAEEGKPADDSAVAPHQRSLAAPSAEEDKPTAALTVSAYSAYIWRGQELSQDSVVIQPNMVVGYKGFSVGMWGNLDTDRYNKTPETNEWTETDLTLAYDWAMGPVGMTAGYIYYAMDSAMDTQEFFVSGKLDTLLSPKLTVYRDTDNLAGWYVTLGVSHSFPIKDEITLDLGGQISYLAADEASSYADPDDATDEYNNFADGVFSVSLGIPVNEYISITPGVYYSFPLGDDAKDLMKSRSIDGDDEDFVCGAVSVSLSF